MILFGDLNSRTASFQDYVVVDEFISHLQNDNLMYEENLDVLHCLDENNFPLDRHSADRTTNFYGKQLIEFCQIKI